MINGQFVIINRKQNNYCYVFCKLYLDFMQPTKEAWPITLHLKE